MKQFGDRSAVGSRTLGGNLVTGTGKSLGQSDIGTHLRFERTGITGEPQDQLCSQPVFVLPQRQGLLCWETLRPTGSDHPSAS